MYIRSGNFIVNLDNMLYAEDADFTEPGHGCVLHFATGSAADVPLTLDELWELITDYLKGIAPKREERDHDR